MIPMKNPLRNSRLALVGALAALSASHPALAQSRYTAVDLGPVGQSAANGIDQGRAVGAVYAPADASQYRATLWPTGGAGNSVDLHPSFLDYAPLNAPGRSTVTAIFVNNGVGNTEVGYGSGVPTNQRPRALKWTGTADSAVYLQVPFDTNETEALGIGIGDGQIVGYGVTVQFVSGRGTIRRFDGPTHALLWQPGASVAVDLQNGVEATVAVSAGGGEQVGYGGKSGFGSQLSETKAMLWKGSASSFVWLHPQKGFLTSQALATDGTQEVGSGLAAPLVRTDSAHAHALLWFHTAASVVDLHPAGFDDSYATGVSETKQVGWGRLVLPSGTGTTHALVWSGSAGSSIDLDQFLPAGYDGAQATGIDTGGTIAGTAFLGGQRHAVLWAPVAP